MSSDLKWFALLVYDLVWLSWELGLPFISIGMHSIQHSYFLHNGWNMSANFSFATIARKFTRQLHSSQQLICPGYKKMVLGSLVVYTTFRGFLLSIFLSSCVSFKSLWFADMVLHTVHKIRLASLSRIQSVTLFTVPRDCITGYLQPLCSFWAVKISVGRRRWAPIWFTLHLFLDRS